MRGDVGVGGLSVSRRRRVGGLDRLLVGLCVSALSCSSVPVREPRRYLSFDAAQSATARDVRYRLDSELYGVEHYVASPAQTARRGEGDCEDFSLYFLSLLDRRYLGQGGRPRMLYLSSSAVPVVTIESRTFQQEVPTPDGGVSVVPVTVSYPVVTYRMRAHAIGIYQVDGLYGTGGQREDFSPPKFRTLEEVARCHARRTGLDAQWGVFTIDRDDWRTYGGDLERFVRWVVPKRALPSLLVQKINNESRPMVGNG